MSDIPDATLQEMIARAKESCANAYCRYSEFPVGAAVLSDTGDIYTGCNVENASYGSTICAERNAIFQMVSRGRRKIKALVIYTPTSEPAAPCGACRQVINEFSSAARVISVCDTDDRNDAPLTELLPRAFGPGNLT